MSKRKVHFSEEGIEEYTGEAEDKKMRFKEKHSLDSDEDEDENGPAREGEDTSNRLTEEDIEGQEEETIRFDGEIRVTPFNLKEEMEEGHFDAEGNYIPDKDSADIHDQWLDSVDWKHVEKYASKVKRDEDDEMRDDEKFDKVKYLKDIVSLLKPGETVLAGLRRLGGKGRSGSSNKRWNRKQKGRQQENTEEGKTKEEEIGKNPELLSELTELADRLLSEGDFEIYQKTYEKINFEIRQEEEIYKDADEDDELEAAFNARSSTVESGLKASETGSASLSFDDGVMWEYKWVKSGEDNLYGPYSSQQMLDWTEQGYFDQGVLCRKIGSTGAFHDAKRIDFELYI